MQLYFKFNLHVKQFFVTTSFLTDLILKLIK